MEDTSTCSFQATHSQASSESSSTYLKPHEDQTSTTTESTSLLQRPPSMLTEASELSRLEQLPPELRLSILTTLDLNQLKTLIKSSPTFYQQYQYDRRCILGSALHTTLGPVALDAYAVYLTSTVKFYHDYPKVRVPKFLKDYQSLRSSPDSLSWEQNLTESEMSGLAMFHLSFIQPLIEKYKNWAMTNIANDFEEQKKTAHTAPLSSTEQLRIMRALYRFQLWCNLFGGFSYMCDREGPPYMFFSLYEPWEVEEISSVHLFATSGFQTDLPHYMYNFETNGNETKNHSLSGATTQLNHHHAEWGLMMWDEPRFRDLQGYKVVLYSCKDAWGIEDPRERFRDQEEDDQEEDDQD
ncbi:hypothetical protein CEP51_008224 [Fusarium floridanum]|uniref:F-box domain-containing protein n=1 Tax=Fusarium floridanum TaxID=1325733 RepID=A0A428RLK9_9HYPO|nr:hypothetical protein CEP51_008224 [Fusarium floridanum]